MANDMLHDIYIGLGSNLGDKPGNLHLAVEKINERIGKVISLSSFYETIPSGFVSENDFLNAACHVRSELSPFDILYATQHTEKELGRKTKSTDNTYSDRIIDIDILLYDDLILQSDNLTLPHPRLHERNFVLLPLAEIASGVYHPIFKKTISELKAILENR